MIISNEHGGFTTNDVSACDDINILQGYLEEAMTSVLFSRFKGAEALKEKLEAEKKIANCEMAAVLQEMLVNQIQKRIKEINEPLPSTVIDRVLEED